MQRTQVRFQLSLWLAAAAALAYLCRNCIVVAESTVRKDLQLSENAMGFILGSFFWSYALAQIPGGWSGQRFGSRRMLPILSVAFSAATVLMGMAQGAASLMAGRLISGVSQAGLFPCSALSVSKWHPPAERAIASGILGAAMSVGAAVAAALTGELLEVLQWRVIFFLYAAPAVVWALFFYRWFRETPAEHPQVNSAERGWIAQETGSAADEVSARSEESLGGDAAAESAQAPATPEARTVPWAQLLESSILWKICGQQFFRSAGQAFFYTWFATYLQESRGVTPSKSGWLLVIPLICTVVAALSGGLVSDAIFRRTGRLTLARSGLAGLSLTLCAVLVLGGFFVENATMATIVIGAGAFFGSLAGPCAYAATMDCGGRNVGPVFSTMNMIGNFGAGLIAWATPRFREWVENSPPAMELCGGNSWNAVLILFGVMYFLAAFCWATLEVTENSLDPE